MRAYHFLQDDMRSGEGGEPAWSIGESRTLTGKIVPCELGYHGSPTLFDALAFAPGAMACIVELSGDVTPHDSPTNKYAARTRKLIAAVDVTRELRLYAADCAEHVLPLYAAAYPNDPRPRLAIQAARDFANGIISAAACDAAYDAARAAAYAAWSAAYAAAYDAARSAANAAAYDAANAARSAANAAYAAAYDAAWSAASDAARAAARAAELNWQRERFDELVMSRLEVIA